VRGTEGRTQMAPWKFSCRHKVRTQRGKLGKFSCRHKVRTQRGKLRKFSCRHKVRTQRGKLGKRALIFFFGKRARLAWPMRPTEEGARARA